MQYRSSQYQTLLSTPDTSTTKHHFHFGPASSFVLELCTVALHYSPIAYWTSSNLGGSSSSVLFFHLFTLSMGFSRQEHCSGSLFPPPVDHILSVLFTVTFWVALHSMAHHITELCKTLHHKAEIHERTLNIREA